MRDKFVGDIGDYGKYGLLRALCGFRSDSLGEKLSLGVVWYLNPSHGDPGGGRLDYLMNPERFRPCDPTLFHTLFWIVVTNRRSVTRVAESDIFPADKTVFFPDPVPTGRRRREDWLNLALAKTSGCEVVFFDPDNGLKDGDLPKPDLSSKHIYSAELGPFAARGQSFIVYHSLNMQQSHERQIRAVAGSLSKGLDNTRIWALRWGAVAPRVYFIIPNGRETVLRPRLEAMRDGLWGEHISLPLET
jgi:hypothetical protein